MVIDLRRSGGNGRVVLPERVVLPRLSDFTAAITDLMEFETEGNSESNVGYEMTVVDFEDVFHTLSLREEDRGIMAIRTCTGWAVFQRLCCGMAAAPLVWCRVGAAAGRLGQALFKPHELRLQIFVDDPAIATRGTPEVRAWNLGILLLFWAVLGFRFNWPKAHRGQTVPWIGAQLSIENRSGIRGVLATLGPKKMAEMMDTIDSLRKAKGLVCSKRVRTLAGQLSWASGLFPWIRAFNSLLWGALQAHLSEESSAKWSARKRPTQLFFVVRIAQALDWIAALLAGTIRGPAGTFMPVQRWITPEQHSTQNSVAIRTDASPFGFGAILFVQGAPAQWIAGEWTEDDAHILCAKIGEAAWQAEWEFLTLLRAVDTWIGHLRSRSTALFQMDATAALHTAARGAGRTPVMNALAAELAIRMESANSRMLPEHLSGTLNFECDALSRLSQGAEIPPALAGVRRVNPRPLSPSFFLAWPRALLEARPATSAGKGPGASGPTGIGAVQP